MHCVVNFEAGQHKHIRRIRCVLNTKSQWDIHESFKTQRSTLRQTRRWQTKSRQQPAESIRCQRTKQDFTNHNFKEKETNNILYRLHSE